MRKLSAQIPLLEAAAISAISTYLLSRLWNNTVFLTFQTRDLNRAFRAAHGFLYFYGPETTGGGNLPGSFYYYLLAIPYKLGFDWRGAWYQMIGLGALALGTTWYFFRRWFGPASAVMALFGLFSQRFFFRCFATFLNPSYLPLFTVLILINLAFAFSAEPKLRRLSWPLACLLIGLSIQLHFTAITLMVASLILQMLGPRIGVEKLKHSDFLFGILSFVLPLLPYVAWIASGCRIGEPVPTYVGNSVNSLPSQLSMVHESWLEALRQNGQSIIANWRRFETPFSPLLVIVVGILTWITAPRSQKPTLTVRSDRRSFQETARNVWLVCALTALAPALSGAVRMMTYRYCIIFLYALAFYLAAWLHCRLSRKEISNWALQITTPRAAVFGLIFSLTPAVFFSNQFMVGQNRPSVLDLYALSSKIIAQTGWSYDEASRSLYFVNTQSEFSIRTIYEQLSHEISSEKRAPGSEQPDGYFVAMNPGWLSASPSLEDTRTFLLSRGLEGTLAEGLKTGAIRIAPPVKANRLTLVPYFVLDPLKVPKHFHNLGNGYESRHSASATATERQGYPYVRAIDRNTVGFVFNDCPDGSEFCRIEVKVQRLSSQPDNHHFRATIDGDLLKIESYFISPDWIQAIYKPYIKFSCDDEKEETHVLAESIGYYRRQGDDKLILDNTLLAPVEREIRTDCKSGPLKITAGYDKSWVIQQRVRSMIYGNSLSTFF